MARVGIVFHSSTGYTRLLADAVAQGTATVAEVRADLKLGASVGVTGTPSFLIGRLENNRIVDATRLVGAQPLSQFEAAISGFQ